MIFVSAEKIGPGPRRAADEHMVDTNLAILFFDGKDLDEMASGTRDVADWLQREFERVSALKRSPRNP